MPGKKMNSIKRPAMYEKLRSHGMSKTQAARISNAASKRGKRKR